MAQQESQTAGMADSHDGISAAAPQSPPPAQSPQSRQQPPLPPHMPNPPGPYGGAPGQQMTYAQFQHAYPWGAAQTEQPMYAPGTAPPELETRGWRITKLALHGASILCSIIGLGTALGIGSSPYLASINMVSAPPVLGLAIIWSVAEFITRAVRKWTRGIHPGAHVGLFLILWLAGGIVGGILAAFAYYASWETCDKDDESDSYYYDDDYNDQFCDGQWPRQKVMITVAAVFICLATLIYFVLFVGACVDTSKRNAQAKRPVMIIAPPYWGPAAQGWQPVPMEQSPRGSDMQHQHQHQQNSQPIPLEKLPDAASATRGQPGSSNQGVTEFYSPGRV